MNQEINFIPDFGAATNGIASRVTWELEGTKPLRCEGVEANPGKRQEFFDGVLCSESVAQTTRQVDVRSRHRPCRAIVARLCYIDFYVRFPVSNWVI